MNKTVHNEITREAHRIAKNYFGETKKTPTEYMAIVGYNIHRLSAEEKAREANDKKENASWSVGPKPKKKGGTPILGSKPKYILLKIEDGVITEQDLEGLTIINV